MIPHKLARLRHVDFAELTWRTREAADTALNRIRTRFTVPRWERRDLARLLSTSPTFDAVRADLDAARWPEAHAGLAAYLETHPARFVIEPRMRDCTAAAISSRFPAAAADAAARGDRLLSGRYDLLGYRDLAFDGRSWHKDPVHDKTAPMRFWADVPYLSADCGDHKVTWEFNRHQHWLELGRAFWLTGDRRYRDECLRQLETWLSANPPLIGINWASMLELAFRSLSWLWALHFFAGDAARDRTPWLIDIILGIDRQLAHVERHLSYYFSPNTHLLGEALALYVAGRALPLLGASPRREALGRRVLLQEVGRQIAPDGGHCERSPHYHRYTLDFYLLALAVARLTDDPAAGLFERTCARLATAARDLANDDGLLPLIGDDDGGSLLPITRRRPDDVRDSLAIAAALTGRVDLLLDGPHEELWWLLGHERFADARSRVERPPRRVHPTSTALPATGYYVSRNDAGDHLVIDGGSHGYLNGGHAHADALALTLTQRHRPLLIDPGTGVYTIDPSLRDRFRSTALHNTLTLNGRSQSLPRGPFHWQHVANGVTRRWRVNRHFDYFAGTHDGYAPLSHYRHVLMLHGDMLVVADCVTAAPNLEATQPRRETPPTNARPAGAAPATRADVHWHIHPSWTVGFENGYATMTAASGTGHGSADGTAAGGIEEGHGTRDAVELHVAGGILERFAADPATGLGWFAPAYGCIVPTTTLRIRADAALPLWIVSVFGFDRANRIERLSVGAIEASEETPHYGAGIRLEREHGIDHVVIAEPFDDWRRLRWRAAGIEGDARMACTRAMHGELTTLALVDGDLYPGLTVDGARRKAS